MRSSTPCRGVPTCTPTWSRRVATTRPGGSPIVPTPTPRRTATHSSTVAASRAGTRRRPRRRPSLGVTPAEAPPSAIGRRPPPVRRSLATELLGHEVGEVGHAWSPTADDVVVRLDHLVGLHSRQRVERRPLGQGRLGLLAALRVGENDEVGGGLDDV